MILNEKYTLANGVEKSLIVSIKFLMIEEIPKG